MFRNIIYVGFIALLVLSFFAIKSYFIYPMDFFIALWLTLTIYNMLSPVAFVARESWNYKILAINGVVSLVAAFSFLYFVPLPRTYLFILLSIPLVHFSIITYYIMVVRKIDQDNETTKKVDLLKNEPL